jgi:hypothetical protein
MADTFDSRLKLRLQESGGNSGQWGTLLNQTVTNIASVFGFGTHQLTSDADATLTLSDDGASIDALKSSYLKITSSVSLTATRTLTFAPNTFNQVKYIENATTGSQSLVIKQGSGATVTVASGKTAVLYFTGSGSGAAVVDALAGVDPGVTDTLAEVLAAGNATGGTDIAVGTGDDVTFADTSKAIFGAGSDLQIYHDGSHSYIKDAGTGQLRLLAGTNVQIWNADATNLAANFNGDTQTSLYYAGSSKLTTTSSGIDVTGSVTADGLTSSTSIETTGSASRFVSNSSSSGDYIRLYAGSGTGKWDIYGNGANLRIGDNDSAGSVVIDTNVGIGTTSITSGFKLEVTGDARFGDVVGDDAVEIGWSSGGSQGFIQAYDRGASAFRDLSINNAVTVTSGGSLGIGNTNPQRLLSIKGTSSGSMEIDGSATSNSQIAFKQGGTDKAFLTYWDSSDTLALTDGSANGLHFSPSSGSVGIGTSSINRKLEIAGNNNGGAKANYIRITDTDTTATAANQQGGIEFYASDSSGGAGISASIEVLYAGSGGGGEITFNTNASSGGTLTEAFRVDENQNLLVSLTSTSGIATGSTANNGAYIDGSVGAVVSQSSANKNFYAAKASGFSDPDFMTFQVAGSEIGSIGVLNSDNLTISGAVADHSGLQFALHEIVPLEANADSNGTISLGSANSKFADLHLAGVANVGGTAKFASWSNSGASNGIEIRSADGQILNSHTGTALHFYQYFYNANGIVGSISCSGSSTAFNTSSDYRLKENVAPMTGATERLKQLLPKRFNFIADADTTVDGFLAHEVQSVVPEAITGAHNEVDDDGNPVYQGIDQSKLVPLLVATIQELEARITQLENN